MFSRFIVSAALIAALGIGSSGWVYDWQQVQKYREEIIHLQDFCAAREFAPTFATVARVVDGDTLKLENGETVRLIGPDTPEVCHFKSNGELQDPDCIDDFFGQEATAFTRELVEGKEIVLVGDEVAGDRDYFGRLLRYVYIGDTRLDLALVREGYAPVYDRLSPRTKFYAELKAAEKEARAAGVGMWGSEE